MDLKIGNLVVITNFEKNTDEWSPHYKGKVSVISRVDYPFYYLENDDTTPFTKEQLCVISTKENMKYNVGDKVRIKSLDWYNRQKNETEVKWKYYSFSCHMTKYCGQIMTISIVGGYSYSMIEDDGTYSWTDEMIEGLVEEETYDFLKTDKPNRPSLNDCMDILDNEIKLPDGYIFKDQAGNEIHALKIVLEKANTLKTQSNMETETHRGYYTTEEETTNKSKKVAWFTFWDNDFADKVELDLSNRELIQEDGKWFVVKKKKEYPKTYEECCEIIHSDPKFYVDTHLYSGTLEILYKLLICRDAYWKIAGDEMGLGKPWEPDLTDNVTKHCIEFRDCGVCKVTYSYTSRIFAFPTKEMRDAFKENFDPDIDICKELL